MWSSSKEETCWTLVRRRTLGQWVSRHHTRTWTSAFHQHRAVLETAENSGQPIPKAASGAVSNKETAVEQGAPEGDVFAVQGASRTGPVMPHPFLAYCIRI